MPNGQLRDKVSGADDLHHAARASLSCSKQVLGTGTRVVKTTPWR